MSETGGGIVPEHREELLQAVLDDATVLAGEERWEEARDLLAGAIDELGDDPLLLTWAGIAAQRLGEEGEAFERFRRALAMDPEDPFVLAAAGSGVAALDDDAAEPALRLAALTAPDLPFARAAYGAYLAREGLLERAIEELEAARSLSPEDPGAHLELGIAHLLAGRTVDGIGALEACLSLAPDDAWVRGLLGSVLGMGDRSEEGAELLHQAAGERPEDVELQLVAALAMAAEGWTEAAEEALARAEAWGEAGDAEAISEVEERLESGAEAAAAFLRDELGPSLLRERLRQRG
jgi:Flp pilus assembly protein TadD